MNKRQSTSIIREIKDNYNTIAKEWDQSRFRPTGVKLQMLKGAKSLLDLGSGNGLMVPEAIKLVEHYSGIDISKSLINIAKKRYSPLIKTGQVDFRVGDARKLPYKSNSFNLIISYAVLHHLPGEDNRKKVFQEIFRVLKPGGEARIINWNLMNDWAYKRFKIKKQLENPNPVLGEGDVFVPWQATSKKNIRRFVHIFTPEELKKLAHEVGFKNIKVYFYNQAGEQEENGEEIVLKIKKSDP